MKWYQIKDKKPPECEDVFVCFNPKSLYYCDILSYCSDSHGKPEWVGIDVTHQINPNDWWTKIELPKE